MAKKARALKQPIHFGDRYGVSAFVPPERISRIAHERTEGMVGYFLACCSRHDPVKWHDQLYMLARSCYMQGLHDMADSAARLCFSERDEPEA
jgi:hypothetical protein